MSARALFERHAAAVIESAGRRGLEAEALCGGPLPAGGELDPTALANVSRNAKLLLDDELCGLTRNPLRVGTFNLMCEVVTLSETLGDALARAFRVYAVATRDIAFALEVDGGTATLTVTVDDPAYDAGHVLPEWWLHFWHRLAQWLICERVPLDGVAFAHPAMASAGDYRDLYGAECRFGADRTEARFPAELLKRRVLRDVSDIDDYIAPKPFSMAPAIVVDGLAALIRARLRSYLEQQRVLPKLEVLAIEFGVCAQTLRRRLEAQGLSYRELKAAVRREVALRYLERTSLSICEVSVRAGFSEPSGLSRAIRAWSGLSPSDYRDQAGSQRRQMSA